MRIHSLALENVRSFRDPTSIEFPQGLTILIGPNAGGKSNLLDILTTILRACFFYGYSIEQSADERGSFRALQVIDTKAMDKNLRRILSKYDDSRPQAIEITFVVDEEDIANITLLKANRERLSQALREYRNGETFRIEDLDQWDVSVLHPGEKITYRIFEHILSAATPNPQDTPYGVFLHYLRRFALFTLLTRDMDEITLTTAFLYFSPFRGTPTPQGFEVTLADQQPTSFLAGYYRATSRDSTSLISLAVSYFAAKRRQLESTAGEVGWTNQWESDTEVQLVTKYLNRLGYSWQLQLRDSMRNVYSIYLEKYEKDFDITQASSGEQEMLNFVLGIFAHNLKNGVLLIDEAELHLHPKWQKLLLEIFQELSLVTHNQIILSTHSGTFLTSSSIRSVIRIYKDAENVSRIIPLADRAGETVRDVIHIVNAHSNEKMFFADKIVLVEGITDRLILERFIALYATAPQREQVIEVLEVHGKMMFSKYRSFLEAMGVTVFQVADLDYAYTIGKGTLGDLLVTDMNGVERKVLKNKKSADRQALAQSIDAAIALGDLTVLRELWHYIKERHIRLRSDLTDEQRGQFEAFLEEQRRSRIFILRQGEIEQYLPAGQTTLDRVIELLEDGPFEDWMKRSWAEKTVAELRDIAATVVGVNETVRQALDQKYAT
jgi:putative ATP-dependent endonuclease of the OLD family